MVEESRLRELTNLENVLREEKEKLGNQCVSVLSETRSSARIPVPAMRLAVIVIVFFRPTPFVISTLARYIIFVKLK